MIRTPDRWARLPFAHPPCTLPFSSHLPTYLLLQVTLDPPPGAYPLRTLRTTVVSSASASQRAQRPEASLSVLSLSLEEPSIWMRLGSLTAAAPSIVTSRTPTSKLLSESKTSASSAGHTPGGCGLFVLGTGNTVRIKLRPREVLVRVSSRWRKVSANREGVRAWPTA